jgi:hypothetical protein
MWHARWQALHPAAPTHTRAPLHSHVRLHAHSHMRLRARMALLASLTVHLAGLPRCLMTFRRRTDAMPPVPRPVPHHPSSVDLELVKRLAATTQVCSVGLSVSVCGGGGERVGVAALHARPTGQFACRLCCVFSGVAWFRPARLAIATCVTTQGSR